MVRPLHRWEPRLNVTLGVLQPGYLPWLGFFDLMRRSDVFVIYDDVQFDKHGWRNRNQIKTAHGPQWLTVPVFHSGREGQTILDVQIDNLLPWARKHLRSIEQAYARAPYLDTYFPQLHEVLSERWDRLVDLDLALIDVLREWLDLPSSTVYCCSELAIPGRRNDRLLALCRHFEATKYLTGNAARAYLDVARFEAAGIEVEWQSYIHPIYPQLHGEFTLNMSMIDLILNCGPESRAILAHEVRKERV
jgi:hypothetical protein